MSLTASGSVQYAHARALLSSSPEGATDYIEADLRDPASILERSAATLDYGRPVALMLLLILHLIRTIADPYAIVATLLGALPRGSYVVLSHPASDIQPAAEAVRRYNELVSVPQVTHCTPARLQVSSLPSLRPGLLVLVREAYGCLTCIRHESGWSPRSRSR
jgi:hypothetical protein